MDKETSGLVLCLTSYITCVLESYCQIIVLSVWATVTLTFDLRPCGSFQQFHDEYLWQVSLSIVPLSKEIPRREKIGVNV